MRKFVSAIGIIAVLIFGAVSNRIGFDEGKEGRKIVEVRVPPAEYPQTTTAQFIPQQYPTLTEADASAYIQQVFENIVNVKYGDSENWSVTSTSYTVFPNVVSYRVVHEQLDTTKREVIISRSLYFKFFTVEFNIPEANAAGIDKYACFALIGDSYVSCEFVERLK